MMKGLKLSMIWFKDVELSSVTAGNNIMLIRFLSGGLNNKVLFSLLILFNLLVLVSTKTLV